MELVFVLEVRAVPVPPLTLLSFVRMIEPAMVRAFPHRIVMLYAHKDYYDMVVSWLSAHSEVVAFDLVYPVLQAIKVNETLPDWPF